MGATTEPQKLAFIQISTLRKEEARKKVMRMSRSDSGHTGVAAHAAYPSPFPPPLCTGGSLLTLTGVIGPCRRAPVHSVEGHVILSIK